MIHIDWRGSGALAVLGIHGMPTPPELMWPLMPEHGRAGVVHLPGYGETPAGSIDVEATLEDLVDTPVVLVGHSGGAWRALRLARRGGLDLRGMVLICPSTGIRTEDEAAAMRAFAEALRAGVDLREAARDRWLTEAEQRDPRADSVVGWLKATPPHSLARELEELAVEPSLRGELGAARGVPTRILVGTEDLATPPSEVRAIADELGVTAELVEGAGHALPVFHAQRIRRALSSLLEQLG